MQLIASLANSLSGGVSTVIAAVLGLLVLSLGGLVPVFGATLSVEAPVLTWQRVDIALAKATPAAQSMFRDFKSWLMQQRGAVNLQFIAISDLTADVNPLDGALRIYAIYVVKQLTATDAFFKLIDDATNDATSADQKVTLPLLESGKEAMAFFPDGIPLADGLVVGAYTDGSGINGTTPTTTGDGPNGFVLVGA